MNDILMTAYILVWPILVAIMMFVMGRAVVRDFLRARRNGEDMV
ncbi:putative transporter small subunit [Lysobacter sp. GX 14042]|nr:putative transporter small subunit [Lysobacter sp. GX 14042]MCE7033038.1 putative transporter small subunit [Lysobacter sp. GX 14042]